MNQQKLNQRFLACIVTILLSVLWDGFAAATPAMAGEASDLAQRVHDHPSGRDLTTLGRMVLTEKGRAPRIREIVTYRLDRSGGETANLNRFLDPEDIAGTGLLSIDKADGNTGQWLYLPALDRVRRISSDRHRLLGRQTENGIFCEVLESVPTDPKDSAYSTRISWIDPATAIPQRVDYFEKDAGNPSKRWLLRSKQRNQGYWTLTDSRMIDLARGHETRMVVDVALYDKKLPSKPFTAQALADESLELEHRP
jgi:hypothetical protein